ncbi:MAG: hypothetical protein J7623_08190 [Chitinophaga sp.]|uniref:hypothetical protein n=1 Tax=Chitinophaga sp. TaxID=1869181 RepID=UPI001B20E40D|nr:hypothetical protein [Chitinophaga sp.]MBO9728600.1 hypothetical protein [Chitinophaga sp.]
MKSGFELFKTRRQDERIDIAVMEAQYNIELPPLYKLFVFTFRHDNSPSNAEKYYIPQWYQYRYVADIDYKPLYDDVKNRLDFTLDDLDRALRSHKYNMTKEVEWVKYGVFRIGGIGMGGGLFVGTREENKDRIFRVR